jgi:DNA-binding CsgD family transcriptional regulator
MPTLARRLFLPLLAIARAERIPLELVSPPPSSLPTANARYLLESARRLELALGGEQALLQAASRSTVWPETALWAQSAPSVEQLARVLWEKQIPRDFPGFTTTWATLSTNGFEARVRFDARWSLRPGLGTILAGRLAATPSFVPARGHARDTRRPLAVRCSYGAGELSIVGDFGASTSVSPERETAAPSAAREQATVIEPTPWAAARGWLEDRALHKVRRLDVAGATQALGDGLAGARELEEIGAVVVDVLTTYVKFSSVRVWLGRASTPRVLCGSVGERREPSQVVLLRAGEDAVGLIEADEEGDTQLLEALAPWIGVAVRRALGGPVSEVRPTHEAPPPLSWTPRQRAILVCLGRGWSNKEIAAELGCAEATVEDHLTVMYRKVGVRGRARLLVELARRGAA